EHGAWTPITSRAIDPRINAVLVDRAQRVWVATAAGVSTIESPGFAGARSGAQRRGESIESPGFAGARSGAQRRGESIDGDRITQLTVRDGLPARSALALAELPAAP